MIAEHGPPAEITIEMTRDFKLAPKKLAELESEQAANQNKNEKRADQIRKLGQAVNARNLLKLRLWEEQNLRDPLDRRCPYSGEVISVERLLSDEIDIDHLIPFSDSWDDSAANKVVCLRQANRDKGNRTPFEAFGNSQGKPYDWDAISLRAALLPKGKRWRFDPDGRHEELSCIVEDRCLESGAADVDRKRGGHESFRGARAAMSLRIPVIRAVQPV